MTPKYSIELELAVRAADEASHQIVQVYQSGDFEVERKDDLTPLTLADRRAHDVIASLLRKTGIPVLSEEGAAMPYELRKPWKRLWVVDPLDGTKEFVKRNGEFTVNIALVEEGVPVLGVVAHT
jgi:3'(2'), 5'-bisphosphate nucleotidase